MYGDVVNESAIAFSDDIACCRQNGVRADSDGGVFSSSREIERCIGINPRPVFMGGGESLLVCPVNRNNNDAPAFTPSFCA